MKTQEELMQVTGGIFDIDPNNRQYEPHFYKNNPKDNFEPTFIN